MLTRGVRTGRITIGRGVDVRLPAALPLASPPPRLRPEAVRRSAEASAALGDVADGGRRALHVGVDEEFSPLVASSTPTNKRTVGTRCWPAGAEPEVDTNAGCGESAEALGVAKALPTAVSCGFGEARQPRGVLVETETLSTELRAACIDLSALAAAPDEEEPHSSVNDVAAVAAPLRLLPVPATVSEERISSALGSSSSPMPSS